MATGDGLYHTYTSWLDDPRIPYASLIGHIARAQGGRGHRAADRPHRAGARPARDRVRRAARRRRAEGVRGAARALADGLPVRRGAQVPLRLLVPDELVEQDPRVRRPARRARLLRGPRRHLPALAARGVLRARRAAADLGDRRAAARPEVLAADRRAPEGAARAARRLDAAAGRRRRAGGGARPGADHALGRDDAARPRLGAAPGGRLGADRHGRVAGRGRGARPRREDGAARSATSATARSSSAASPRPRGRRSSRRSRRR